MKSRLSEERVMLSPEETRQKEEKIIELHHFVKKESCTSFVCVAAETSNLGKIFTEIFVKSSLCALGGQGGVVRWNAKIQNFRD